MQVALEHLPIQERFSLIRQVWDSIVNDSQANAKDIEIKKAQLQQTLDSMPNKKASNSANFFQAWEKWHEESKEFLDDDVSWADVRDKSDTGRDVIFED